MTRYSRWALWLVALLSTGAPLTLQADERHERGRELYNYRCYYCHGYSGDAKTLAATYMQPAPRNFAATPPEALSRQQMIDVVTQGLDGTAMKSFQYYLNEDEIATVVDFVRTEFMEHGRENTRYHTVENGWPDHQRYAVAFPFATGELALDMPQEAMTPEQRQGLRLFLTSCVSCHDRARVNDEGAVWELHAISYPRNNFSFTQFDGTTSASVYAEHDTKPEVEGLSRLQQEGERLFQDNCAFCHAADGTGKNWIGSFLATKPRNLTDSTIMTAMTRDRLKIAIEEGLVGTSMPAWKSVLSGEQIEALISYIDAVFHPLADTGSDAAAD